MLDDDLDAMDRDQFVSEIRRLRHGIREHRDSSGHGLCWHHPKLWGLLPEPIEPQIAVPPWPKFLRGCVHYRQSLDEQALDASIFDHEYDEGRVKGGIAAFWRRIDRPGHDSAMIERSGDGYILTGFAAFSENGSTGVRYQLELGRDYSTRSATIAGIRDGHSFRHSFRRAGAWHLDEVEVPGLDDLIHLDFGFTPSTNLQQLRHEGLEVGGEAEIAAAWFDIGEASLVRLPHHYRRIAEDRYHYSSPTASYSEVLEIAPSGFVRLYPGLWEMEGEP
ncbi:MAG TPA: putative glycolipid-binding domain-containing protein [Nitrospiraceae bacterium]|nr:putative glycolipid-binding domain-containing protein [Nitrospiraceae bacterium]